MSRTPDDLKSVMENENLHWRSFADDGSIRQQWNTPPTPAYYVLDHRGVIRHKWIGHPGEDVMDAALDELIEQVP